MNRVQIKITDREKNGYTDLSAEKLDSLLNKSIAKQSEAFEIIGWGSTLHPKLDKILNVIEKYRPHELQIETDGCFSSNIPKLLGEKSATSVKVRLAGITPTSNDKLLGKGSFDRTMKAIKALKREGLKIRIVFLITHLNWQSLPAFIEFAKGHSTFPYFTEFIPEKDSLSLAAKKIKKKDAKVFWRGVQGWIENGTEVGGHSAFLGDLSSPEEKTIMISEKGKIETKKFTKSGKRSDSKKVRLLRTVYSAYRQAKKGTVQNELCMSEFSKGILKRQDIAEVIEAFKLVRKMEHIEHDWIKSYKEIPPQINLELTSKKHLSFPFINKTVKGKEATSAKIDNIVKEMQFFSIRKIILSGTNGGDILLYSDLLRVVEKLLAKKFEVTLQLDGWNFKKNIRKLIELTQCNFCFDLYGSSSYTHDKLVGKSGSFDKVMDAIEILLDRSGRAGFNYVLAHENVEELEQMIDFSGMLNLPFFYITKIDDKFASIKDRIAPTPKDIKKATKLIDETKEKRISTDCIFFRNRELLPAESIC